MMNVSYITARMTVRMMMILACVWLVAGMTSCDSSDDTTPSVQPDGGMAVSISIMTGRSVGTRAVTEYDRVGTDKENAIDVADGDYRVFLFDSDGIFAGRLKDLEPEDGSEKDRNVYRITGVLDIRLLDFYIVVLANWEQNGYYYPDPVTGKTTIADLMYAQGYTFNIAGGWQPLTDGSPKTGGIPMFGMHRYTVSREDALAATKDNPVNLSPTEDDAIWMMRSMAKIEVVDAMKKFGYSSYPKLESVTFGPYMEKGKLLPDAKATGGNAIWTNGSQVTTLSLPTGISPTESRLDFFHTLDTDRTNDGGDPMAYVKRDVMAAYIAEQDLTAGTSGGKYTRPYMAVTIRNRAAGTTGNGEETVTFRLDIPDDMGTRLLRNHIYRFEVRSTSANLINIDYVVCPWVVPEPIDIPSFD